MEYADSSYILLICAIAFMYIGWRIGKISITDQPDDVQVITINGLSLEKINNIYYAYLGEKFVGQSSSIDELVHNMRYIYKVSLFNFDSIESLTNDENDQVRQSIEKWYTII